MKVAILGAGAAGLMTAATIVEENPSIEVFVIERNSELGKKIMISGGGRCNVTTGLRDMRTLFTKYPRGAKFLSSALYGFPPEAVYEWFESHGVPLKIEDDLRVFPVSNNGRDVVGALERVLDADRVHILRAHTVTQVHKHGEQFTIQFRSQESLVVDRIVLTTGGQAYRTTGSQGDGYKFAEMLGHSITPLAASLNSFIAREKWTKDVAGVSWQSVELSVDRGTKTPITGPCMFTHRGITGPAVFALSAAIAFEPISQQNPLTIFVNFFPELSAADLQNNIKRACTQSPKRSIENIIATLVPKSIAEKVCMFAHVAAEKHGGELSNAESEMLGSMLHALPLEVIGRGAGDEFVTAGGVELSEVNPSTMESKITPGVFFAGEILNIDAVTGGYNLQAALATGRLAGMTIAGE